MSAHASYMPQTRLGRFVHGFEENAIAHHAGPDDAADLRQRGPALRLQFSELSGVSRSSRSCSPGWCFSASPTASRSPRIWASMRLLNIVSPKTRRVFGILSAVLCVDLRAVAAERRLGLLGAFAGLAGNHRALVPDRVRSEHPRPGLLSRPIRCRCWAFCAGWKAAINEGEAYSKLPARRALYDAARRCRSDPVPDRPGDHAHPARRAGEPDRQPRGRRRGRRGRAGQPGGLSAWKSSFSFSMIIGLLLIGVPIAVSLGLSSMLFLLIFSDTSLASIAQSLYQRDGRAFDAAGDPVLHPGLELHVDGRRGAADHPLFHRLRRPSARRSGDCGRVRLHAVRGAVRLFARHRGRHRLDRHRGDEDRPATPRNSPPA